MSAVAPAPLAGEPAIGATLVAGVALLFAATRLPRERVALAALVAGVALGAVPAAGAFAGFGDDAAVTLAAFMLVSGAVVRSGVVELAARPVLRALADMGAERGAERGADGRVGRRAAAVPVFAGAAALLSAVVRDAAALRLLLPFARQVSDRADLPRAALLMPTAFAAMLGGSAVLTATPANLIVSRYRAVTEGGAFGLFAFLPVAAGAALAGLLFLAWGWRLLPAGPGGAEGRRALAARTVTAEARVPADSPYRGRTVAALEAAGVRVSVTLILRERFHRVEPAPDRPLAEGDVLLLLGEPDALERLISEAGLVLGGDAAEASGGEMADGPAPEAAAPAVREGLVAIGSPLVGATAVTAGLEERHGLSLLAIGHVGPAPARRLRFRRFAAGDVLVLKGTPDRLADGMEALRVLPLSDRPVALGARRRSLGPAMVLGVAAALAAAGTVPVSVAFVGAAVAALMLDDDADGALGAVEWRTIVTLAALIPLADALVRSGATAAAARALAGAAGAVPPPVLPALAIAAAGIVASRAGSILTALVLAPVAAGAAARLGLATDAALIAVALGSACAFLDPRGRAAMEAVAAQGGYSPADFRRLGVPMLLVVAGAGAALIAALHGVRPG